MKQKLAPHLNHSSYLPVSFRFTFETSYTRLPQFVPVPESLGETIDPEVAAVLRDGLWDL